MCLEKYNNSDYLKPTTAMKNVIQASVYLFRIAELMYSCMIMIVGVQLSLKK
jgi:hypothetical protein